MDNSGGMNLFQPGIFPSSSSRQSSSSSSRTGINWNSPLLKSLTPQLQGSINALPGTIDNMARTMQDQQTNLARQSLGPQAFQGTLNDLASRGMLNSSVAGDALYKTAAPIMQGVLDRGYDSSILSQQAKIGMPSLLSQIAQLGQETNSSQRSSSKSSESNPLAPYKLAADIILGMQ